MVEVFADGRLLEEGLDRGQRLGESRRGLGALGVLVARGDVLEERVERAFAAVRLTAAQLLGCKCDVDVAAPPCCGSMGLPS